MNRYDVLSNDLRSLTASFSSDLSHEFKNPLASIRAAADVALDNNDTEELKQFLFMINGLNLYLNYVVVVLPPCILLSVILLFVCKSLI